MSLLIIGFGIFWCSLSLTYSLILMSLGQSNWGTYSLQVGFQNPNSDHGYGRWRTSARIPDWKVLGAINSLAFFLNNYYCIIRNDFLPCSALYSPFGSVRPGGIEGVFHLRDGHISDRTQPKPDSNYMHFQLISFLGFIFHDNNMIVFTWIPNN